MLLQVDGICLLQNLLSTTAASRVSDCAASNAGEISLKRAPKS